jgi:hypothetical protein
MQIQNPNPKMMELSIALCNMRDSFTRLSLLLSDFIAEAPSLHRDEVAKEVEMRLAKTFETEGRTHAEYSLENYLPYAKLAVNVESTFPKRCNNCGLVYQTTDVFLHSTQGPRSGATGLKQGHNDDGSPNIELFRNCTCGSTLMAEFQCRRDKSASGRRQRGYFFDVLRRH